MQILAAKLAGATRRLEDMDVLETRGHEISAEDRTEAVARVAELKDEIESR